MTKLVYYFFYALSKLPFGVLYAIADAEYVLMFYIIRYRRKVVRRNLTSAFPDKSISQIRDIEHHFYHWFCDYFFEAVKLLSISDDELRRRFTIYNSEQVEHYMANGQSCAAILGHYCNWEWLSCVGLNLPRNRKVGLIYHPLYNDAFNNLFIKIRSHEPNSVTVPKKDILRYLVSYRKQGIMSLFGYISDQAPKWENIHLWLDFLHHDTPVFTGAERIMRMMNNAVFYVEMSRPRRGYYTATYKLITDEPAKLPKNEITRQFFAMLEQTITRQPYYYLWTHNRWKRTHEEFNRRFEIVNSKVLKRKNV